MTYACRVNIDMVVVNACTPQGGPISFWAQAVKNYIMHIVLDKLLSHLEEIVKLIWR